MTPLPWSYSALSDFINCPKQYYHKRIAKDVVDPPNAAGLWGDYVHKEFQKYLSTSRPGFDHPRPLPEDLEHYRGYLDAIAGLRGEMHVECKYAINKNLEPCDFFADDVWCRAILDVIHIDGSQASVLDHKTGKRRRDTRQLKLSALMTFIFHPQVNVVKTAYFWLKDKECDDETYLRLDILELWNDFLPDLQNYRTAAHTMTFVPKPSGLCNGWCPVHTCEFWRPKRRE